MPVSLSFDSENGIVVAICTGTLRAHDAKEAAAVFWSDLKWSGKPVVWDFRSAELDVRGTDVQEIARFIIERQPKVPPPRVAFVAGRDVDYGLGRMYQVYRQHPATQVRIFRDYDEAVSWARSGYPPA